MPWQHSVPVRPSKDSLCTKAQRKSTRLKSILALDCDAVLGQKALMAYAIDLLQQKHIAIKQLRQRNSEKKRSSNDGRGHCNQIHQTLKSHSYRRHILSGGQGLSASAFSVAANAALLRQMKQHLSSLYKHMAGQHQLGRTAYSAR